MGDTDHLTNAESGLYLRILMTMWRSPECRIPNDDVWLSRRLRSPIEEIRPLIAEFCQTSGNWVTQKRLRKEWNYVQEKRKKQTDAANARWNKDKGTCERISDGDADRQCERNAPTPTPTPNKKEYHFEDGVIRLNQVDFEKWRDAFPNIDLKAELLGLSAWASTQSNWFHAVKGALAKRNREHKPRQAGAKTVDDILNPTDRRSAWGLP